jgi:maltooligosyltrehalose trehalohydrolase
MKSPRPAGIYGLYPRPVTPKMPPTETITPAKRPVGADFSHEAGGTRFRVWATTAKTINVVLENGKTIALQPEPDHYFSVFAKGVTAGAQYKFQMDGGEAFPDPASCFQPKGPHGPSQVVDPTTFQWTDAKWPGIRLEGQVIYELHLGTFTKGGAWKSAAEKLAYLRDTGITIIEIMPIADFPGKFGWGYDGVQLYAPASLYGQPDDMRAFVDKAHSLCIGVILDVVYNHLGPDGNYLEKYSPDYFTDKHKTDWGRAINFDGENSVPVREFFRANAAYWIRDFHLDGLRLDATQDIHDDRQPHMLAEISQAARLAADNRSIILVGENEPQKTRLLLPVKSGGYGLDALWNDDYHHSAAVALTGKSDAYYSDYRGTAQEFLSAMKYGFLYQGQHYRWQKKKRGTPTLGLPRPSMVTFLQNHDQVANSARGQRAHQLTSPGVLRALTALTLLGPGTPMLFQGQEFASSAPFLFFADHEPDLARKIKEGRKKFLEQWRSLQLPEIQRFFDDPALQSTFERCILDFSEVNKHAAVYALHRDLLRLRRTDPIISKQGASGVDGAVLSPQCFILRYFSAGYDEDRLLVVNLGSDLEFDPAPEPLLAPPALKQWTKLWSSDDPEYGGCATAALDGEEIWTMPGQSAVVLRPILIPKLNTDEQRL